MRNALNPLVSLLLYFYRPQRSWAKVIFLHVSVILLTGEGVSGPRGCVSGPGRGVCLVPGGVSNFSGGFSKFFFFSNLFFPKFLLGCTNQPTPPPRDGQCAAGTHPTGMHSC